MNKLAAAERSLQINRERIRELKAAIRVEKREVAPPLH